MPRPLEKLTKRDIDNAEDGWLGDGGGLWLRTDDGGRRKRWVFKYTRGGKTTELGLGTPPDVTLAKARELRKAHMEALIEGRDPKEEKRKAARVRAGRRKFSEAAEAVIAAKRKAKWRKSASGRESSFTDWTRTLEVDCKPLWDRWVDEIDMNDVKAVVARFWDADQHDAVRRTLNRIENVIEYAVASGWRTADNPARWKRMQHIFPAPETNVRHHAATPYKDMPALMTKLRASPGMASRALELIILTAARSGEVLRMTWREVDLDAAVWTIPAERMKAKEEHTVPLSSAAMALIDKLAKAKHRPSDYVFPGADSDAPLTNSVVWLRTQILTDGAATTHGFRSSARTWMTEHGIEREVGEACLAHVLPKVERAYNRAQMLTRKREALQRWSDFLDGGTVVPFKRRRA